MPDIPPIAAYGQSVSLTDSSTVDDNEACAFVSGAGAAKLYQVTNTAKRLWDPTVPVVVKDGGTVVSAADYVFNYLFGFIQFTAHAVGGAITVSGSYLPIVPYANASKFDFTIKQTLVDTTFFGSQAVLRTPTITDAEGTIEAFDSTLTILDGDMLDIEAVFYGQKPFVNTITLGAGALRCFALFESPKTSGSVADVVKSAMAWKLATPNPNVPAFGFGF